MMENLEENKIESFFRPMIQNMSPLIIEIKEPIPERDCNISNLYESRSQISNPPNDIKDIMQGDNKQKNGGCIYKKTTVKSGTR